MLKKFIPVKEEAHSSAFDPVLLGETIRLLRERLKMTQADLGRLAHLSTAEISKLENGSRKKLPLETLVKISPHLNVSLDYLLVSCLTGHHNDRERFYDYDGNEIDLYKIAKNLYSVDADLLLLLASPDFLSDTETINFIKLWIKFNKFIGNNSSSSKFFEKVIHDFKNYCLNFIETMQLYKKDSIQPKS